MTPPTASAARPLLPPLAEPTDKEAIRFDERAVSYMQLAAMGTDLAARIAGATRVAVWATPSLETCLGVVGALLAGVPVVPINPKSGYRELGHIATDSAPDVILAAGGDQLPPALVGVRRIDLDLLTRTVERHVSLPPEAPPDAPAVIVYTSGTTGPPKGAVLPRRAIASNLDALAAAWEWTGEDVLTHALPLFHVHGLIIGTLGPLRLGGTLLHLGRFSSEAVAAALAGQATMLFGVPTMYHRLADEAEHDDALVDALRRARLLVSGSAALPTFDHERLAQAAGQCIVERYGMTETLMNCAVRAVGDRRPGTVGPPLDGVEVRLVDDDGAVLDVADDETVGELEVRGPNLLLEYLNRPDATAEAMTADGWFRTGDMATRAADGYIRLVGRRATDIIKSGGFKIGAGEIEGVLVEHPGVAEAAVTGEPDPDLGERVVAWIVPSPGARPSVRELVDHVARQLSPHKRPRDVRFLDALPRNAMGKVLKKELRSVSAREAIAAVADEFIEHNADVESGDPLRWPGYAAQLRGARDRSGEEEAVVCGQAGIGATDVAIVAFEFAFMGGSMGEATGRKIVDTMTRARVDRRPVVTLVASGGFRMQEGMRSLVQMQRIAAACHQLRAAGVPHISVVRHPTTGGVWAALAAGADLILAERGAVVAFSGRRVRGEAHYNADAFTAEGQLAAGQVDMIVDQADLRSTLALLLDLLPPSPHGASAPAEVPPALGRKDLPPDGWTAVQRARDPNRPRAQQYLEHYFEVRVGISGDRVGGTDPGMHCGVGRRDGRTIAYAAQAGTATTPAGFRTAARLVRLADRLNLPILTLIDTPGAANDAAAERAGLAAGINDLLAAIASAQVPITTLVIGEGGSGGALALASPTASWITPDAYFAVIAPEAATAILKHHPGEAPVIAGHLRLRPQDLLELGIVRDIAR